MDGRRPTIARLAVMAARGMTEEEKRRYIPSPIKPDPMPDHFLGRRIVNWVRSRHGC